MLFRALLDTLFPPLCHLCKVFIPDAGEIHLCAGCREKITCIDIPLCTVCGLPFFTEGGSDHLCSSCRLHPPSFVAARAACVFDGPMQGLIHHFKYSHKVHLSRCLGLLVAERLQDFAQTAAADLLIPVPLHRRRLRWRGYNQALLVGDVLARKWRLPLMPHNLRRIRWTEPQINLAAPERQQNVRGAFAVKDSEVISGKRILLVDDVLTTGSTVEECSRTLKKGGAAAVFVVTVARAL